MNGTYLIVAGMLMIFAGFLLIIVANRNAAKYYGGEGNYTSGTHTHPDNSGTSAGNAQYKSQYKSQYEPVTNKTEKTEVRGGGIIMLGPIPIIIGSDSSATKTLMILAIALMVLYFLIFM